jgi:hypothetical protein
MLVHGTRFFILENQELYITSALSMSIMLYTTEEKSELVHSGIDRIRCVMCSHAAIFASLFTNEKSKFTQLL